MSRSTRAWLLLSVAVLAVAAVLWVLEPRGRSRDRNAAGPEGGAAGGRAGEEEAGAGAGRGVGRREITVAGDGWVRGHVVDEDGAAVGEGRLVLWCLDANGAVTRIRDGVLSIDDEGRFEGPACRGEVCPELHHSARVPAEPWVLRPGTEVTLETRLLPRLWGRVVDAEGAAVAGASVTLMLPPDEYDEGLMLGVSASQTSSDAEGEFSVARLERPPCDPCQVARDACPSEILPVSDRVLVTVRAPGWAPGSRIIELGQSDPEAPVEVSLPHPTAAITGRLVDAAGASLPRGVVLARSEPWPQEQHHAEADDGMFALETLAEGPYTLRALQDGRELARREGVEPGASVGFVLELELRDVELELRDSSGRPWPEVQVEGGPFAHESSDSEGRVRAQGVVPGPYILRLRPPGGAAQTYDLEIPEAGAGAEISQVLRIEVAPEG